MKNNNKEITESEAVKITLAIYSINTNKTYKDNKINITLYTVRKDLKNKVDKYLLKNKIGIDSNKVKCKTVNVNLFTKIFNNIKILNKDSIVIKAEVEIEHEKYKKIVEIVTINLNLLIENLSKNGGKKDDKIMSYNYFKIL